ncbi:hypothetical protein V1358_17760 [Pseudoalteromonas sp. YIC-656]|uniref:tetratricopeptide repeat protein n=1 Tax=Pseudoalteromonas pernae TaxID=3118054 RepID=UPI003242452E
MLPIDFKTKTHFYSFLFILFAITSLLYLGTLSVPFYLDDFESIVNNPVLYDQKINALLANPRAIGLATFYLQYKLGINSPEVIHLINSLIHALNAVLVSVFVWLLSKKVTKDRKQATLTAAICGVIYAIHPLNSQPVIYAIQRYTLLCTLFYLLTLISFVYAREQLLKSNTPKALCAFFVTLIFAALAFFSKQTAATIPLSLIAVEVIFYRTSVNNKRLLAIAIAASVLAVAAIYALPDKLISQLDNMSRETKDVSRLDYFSTQLVVVWGYITKFFVPINLRLEYSINESSFTSLQSIFAGVVHIAIIAVSFVYRRKLPLVCFGVLFYYISLSIESSIIPIRDFSFEHRAYLPNIGLSLIVAVLLSHLGTNSRARKVTLTSLLLLIGISISLTFTRITLWQDRVAFYENEYRLNPTHLRVISNLGLAYLDAGQRDKGKTMLKKAAALNTEDMRTDVGSNYLALLVEDGDYTTALTLGDNLLKKVKNSSVRSRVEANLGIAYLNTNNLAAAEKYLQASLRRHAQQVNTLYALVITQVKLGKMAAALKTCEKLLAIEPQHKETLSIYSRLKALADRQNIAG